MLLRACRWASRARAGSHRRCCWGADPSAPPCPQQPPSSAPSSPPSSWRSTGCARRWWCAAHTPRSPFSVPQPPIPCRAHTSILIASLLLYLQHALWWVLWMVFLHQEGAFTACAALPAGAREAQGGGGCCRSKAVPAAGGGARQQRQPCSAACDRQPSGACGAHQWPVQAGRVPSVRGGGSARRGRPRPAQWQQRQRRRRQPRRRAQSASSHPQRERAVLQQGPGCPAAAQGWPIPTSQEHHEGWCLTSQLDPPCRGCASVYSLQCVQTVL